MPAHAIRRLVVDGLSQFPYGLSEVRLLQSHVTVKPSQYAVVDHIFVILLMRPPAPHRDQQRPLLPYV